MKIFRLIARLNVGGPARHVVWLTKGLNDEEFHSVLVAGTVPPGEEDMAWFAGENGVSPVFVPELSRELSVGDMISLFKVYRLIRREAPDIIHTHTAKAGTIGRAAGFLYRWFTWGTLVGKPRPVRIVHTFHGHVFHSYYGVAKTKIFLAIERVLARLATDKIITITGQQFDEIHRKFNVGRKEQFEVIPLGIDLDIYRDTAAGHENFRDEVGAAVDDILVGFVGRLTEIKNIGLLLKVAEIYKNDDSTELPRLRFVIVGDGNLREQLEKESVALGLAELVNFVGNRSDPDVFYPGLDIIALTSHNEGTPLSLIEGMACGKPVVATNVGGVIDLLGETEIEEDGFRVLDRGVLVTPNSPEVFYNGLIYLAKNEKLREKLAAEGQNFVLKSYDKNRLVDDIKDMYRNLVKGRNG